MQSIESLLEDARKRLVETGTRNRLIHVNRKTTRGNLLNIINERSDDVFQILRLNSKKMRFAGKGDEESDLSNEDGLVLSQIDVQEFDEGRYTDSVLETPLTPDALQKRLLKLFKDARTAEEEQGINILFLAIGFLQWYEDGNSKILRESPLILLPVELVRNNKTSTYDLVCRDDDIVTNLSLQERLKLDFGISLPEIDDSQDWIPSEYFDKVEERISGKDRWKIDLNGIQLGFFSFAKLMMLRDLDPVNWDEQSLSENKLISGLLADGFEPESPLFKDGENLDKKLPPNRILHVVDADSSQTKVIEEVRSGRNLVVQGPPGTGKSQTITNILAAAAHDNKKVLFVAEKMAALEVVYNRMCKVGLQDLCLELHSRRANKKIFLQEMAETISKSKGIETPNLDTEKLKSARDELNRITSLLHENLPERDFTPFEILSKLVSFVSRSTKAPRFDATQLESIKKEAENELFASLDDYLDIIGQHGFGLDNPFFGVSNVNLQPTDLQRLVDELKDTVQSLEHWNNYQNRLERQITLESTLTFASAKTCSSFYQKLKDAPNSTELYISLVHANVNSNRFNDALDAANEWISHKLTMSEIVNDTIWSNDVAHLRQPIVNGLGSFLSRIFGKYRSAGKELNSYLKGELPKSPDDRLKLLDAIIEGKSKKIQFENETEFFQSKLGGEWRGEKTPFADIKSVVTWLQSLPKELVELSSDKLKELILSEITESFTSEDFDNQINACLQSIKKIQSRLNMSDLDDDRLESVPLVDLKGRMIEMISNIDDYSVWTLTKFARDKLLNYPCIELVNAIEEGEIDLEFARFELDYALSEVRWNYALNSKQELNNLSRIDRHELVAAFTGLEQRHVEEVQKTIRECHLSKVPKGSAGEMGLIRGEIAKKRNHRPIRQMMLGAAEMIQRIKPILFMSPISVAQFLPPGKIEFDLLVIDEASQVKPEDALGSIARAKQIVVVGDQKQLPPTSFFDRLTDNTALEDDQEDEISGAKATEMESILSLCEARGLSESMLEWHYRSRDPSLIAVSNVEFYRNRLILPPCPTESDENFGLKLIQVPGVYSTATKGGGRPTTNRIEAESIAERLKELALSRADFSVGIVTFSKSQADMVTEVLEFRRREDEVLDEFLREDKMENVFVKNIENVQGDERDIILISVGYGPHEANGRLTSMSFGPINSEGGERRLNVLFSRSRIACEVFTSFNPGDIDLSRTSKEGPAVLKKFLEYAKSGVLKEHYVSEGEPDSFFEEDVADEIRTLGYNVDYQVGTAGFKIDLGVLDPENPNHHILAVECDGATYHSALSARERDRMRQSVLEGFGWHFHRIWSTDWFYQRKQEIERLKKALEDARNRDLTASVKGSNQTKPIKSDDHNNPAVSGPIVLEESRIKVPLYQKANPSVNTMYEPHERPMQQVKDILLEIVRVEGPIYVDEVARRYASAHGKSRVGSRINDRVIVGLANAQREQQVLNKGKFWGTKEQFANVPVRDRSKESVPTTNAESISEMEINACAFLIQNESGNVNDDEMIRVIAKILGFKRAGPDFQTHVLKCLKNR